MTIDRALRMYSLNRDSIKTVDEKGLKSIYRSLVKKNHPDEKSKVSSTMTDIKDAYVILVSYKENTVIGYTHDGFFSAKVK